jgi:hypothetical protein
MQSLPHDVDSQTLNRLAENERHFHTIQAGIRGLASTWVLGAFAGIAVLLQQKSGTTWVFPSFALIVVICLMANIGLTVLWIIDQRVYQRLFNTNYLAGLRLEQQFPFIPPVRAIQALTARRKSIAFWVQFFYLGPILAFAIAAAVAAVISNTTAISYRQTIAMALCAALALVPFAWVMYKAREVAFFRLVTLLPIDYSAILKEENCLSIIERHLEWLNAINPSVKKMEGTSTKGDAS